MREFLLAGVFLISFLKATETCGQDYADSLKAYREKQFNILQIKGVLSTENETYSLKYFDPDKNFIVKATVDRKSEPKIPLIQKVVFIYAFGTTYPITEGRDPRLLDKKTSVKASTLAYFGDITFQLDSKKIVLQAYTEMPETAFNKGVLIIPFKDITNRFHTFKDGRYLSFRVMDIREDNSVILDFNNSFNPPCAYKTGLPCIVVPSANMLEVEIKAGEKRFLK